jgi:ABC-2 type transport system ATP-binding protein
VRDPRDLDRGAAALGPNTTVDRGRRRVSVPATSGTDDLVAAVGALRRAGVRVEDVALRRPTLDDVFLALTGHTTSDTEPDPEPTDEEVAA